MKAPSMKLAVSNIAFAPEDRLAAYAMLRRRGIEGLEIAPGLLFADARDPFAPSDAECAEALAPIADAGLQLVSMQSLLFGVQGAELFGDADARARFRDGMERAIALAGRLAIPAIVFGSPRQRIVPDDMAMADALDRARAEFAHLGAAAASAGTCILIEANPAAYGTNFLNSIDQAAAFVARVDHPGIGLILDVGSLHLNAEFDRIDTIASRHAAAIRHVHVSEPDLAPAPASVDHGRRIFGALRAIGYDRWVSIEMVRPATASMEQLDAAVARLVDAHADAIGEWNR